MAVVKLTTANFDQEVLQADRPVLVDFYADWCGPCKMMGPVVEEISGELDDVKVCKIKNGEMTGKQVGAVPKGALADLVK